MVLGGRMSTSRTSLPLFKFQQEMRTTRDTAQMPPSKKAVAPEPFRRKAVTDSLMMCRRIKHGSNPLFETNKIMKR